ncbi:MAG TPA: hemolysin III family protein [Xanthobacteraceae bacterium]|nr:hemolysin III family protein [Xanthobacteraceae bacterium]
MIDADGRPLGLSWNYDRAETIADGVVHVVGIALGVVGAVALAIIAARSARGAEIAAVLAYGIGLLAVLGLSAAYNLWPVSRAKWLLRRFDHSAIYLLIAGTYTPFIVQLKSGLVAGTLLVSIWATAAVGIALKLMLPGRFDRFSIMLYLLLGWSGAMAYDTFIATLSGAALGLLALGGALYSLGVVFHLWQNLRFQNVIWHAFVLLAACCHYFAVLETVALAGD